MPKLRDLVLPISTLFVLLIPAEIACAQSRRFDIDAAAGVALPGGMLGSGKTAGPMLRLGVASRPGTRRVAYRLHVEALRMGHGRQPSGYSRGSSPMAASVAYSALFRAQTDGTAPYLVAGGGVAVVSSGESDSWPGITTTMSVGVGVRTRFRWVHLTAEITAVGATRHLSARYYPATIGVAF